MMSLADAMRLSKPAKSLMPAVFLLFMFSSACISAEKMAVFEFEIIRSNVIAGVREDREAEGRRLAMIGARLRERLAASGRFELVDIAPAATKAAASNLQACGGCAGDFAKELGARFAVTGTVQKVSELILNINVYVSDAETQRPLAAVSVDIRGNTDESWRRGIDYLCKNVLMPRLAKLRL